MRRCTYHYLHDLLNRFQRYRPSARCSSRTQPNLGFPRSERRYWSYMACWTFVDSRMKIYRPRLSPGEQQGRPETLLASEMKMTNRTRPAYRRRGNPWQPTGQCRYWTEEDCCFKEERLTFPRKEQQIFFPTAKSRRKRNPQKNKAQCRRASSCLVCLSRAFLCRMIGTVAYLFWDGGQWGTLNLPPNQITLQSWLFITISSRIS